MNTKQQISKIIISVLAIAIVVYLGYGIYNSVTKAIQGYQVINTEQQRLDELNQKKSFLEAQIAYMNSDDFIKKQSLILFNKVSDNERIYVVPDDLFDQKKLTYVNVREILDKPNPVTRTWYEDLIQLIFHTN